MSTPVDNPYYSLFIQPLTPDFSKWPHSLGLTLTQPVPSSAPIHKAPKTEIPCKMFLNGLSIGRETQDWNYHRKARCWASSNDSITLVQVTGLSNWLQKGDYFEVYVPNLLFCDEPGKACRVKVQFNSMYHHDPNFVLNERFMTLGTVQPVSAYIPCKCLCPYTL